MLDLTDFGPNPHVPRYGNYGALIVRSAGGPKVSGPRRRDSPHIAGVLLGRRAFAVLVRRGPGAVQPGQPLPRVAPVNAAAE